MQLKDLLLPEFDQEMANTRKTLERVPENRMDWRPHARSWTMAELATHIANLPTWVKSTMEDDSLDLAPPGAGGPPKITPIRSRDDALARFDANIAGARESIAAAENSSFLAPWTLLSSGKIIFTLPRLAVLRSFVMNHIIHHRAQLTVYLRCNDVPVPALYGPSADEEGM